MTTLKDIWLSQGMDSHQAAEKAGISIGTLYSCNRKENVKINTVQKICKALGISLDEYAALDACPRSEEFKQ